MPEPDVTVIAVTWNSARHLPGMIESLPGGLGRLAWELVVVDNDSVDDTARVLERRAPFARWVELGSNAGYAAGINAGYREAHPASRAVLVLNPDVRLSADAVPRMLDSLAQPGSGMAVPTLVDEEGQLCLSLRREPTVTRALGESLLGGYRAGHYSALGEVVVAPATYAIPGVADR